MNILLAIDDDPVRNAAIEAVQTWLPSDAMVVALHVGDSPTTAPAEGWPIAGPGGVAYPQLTARLLRQNAEEIERQAREVAGRAAAAVDGEARVEVGTPAATIRRVAEEIDADLIVVGTGDRPWLSRLLQPSVGSAVADSAPCSVLIVRDRTSS